MKYNQRYNKAMNLYPVRLPESMWNLLNIKAQEMSNQSGKRIARSDLIRVAIKRFLKDI